MSGVAQFLVTVVIYTAVYLLHLAIPLLLVYLLGRRWFRPWLSAGKWRPAKVLGGLVAVVFLVTAWSQFYSPWLEFDQATARYWMRQAAEAPTREEKERHVQRVARTVKGGYVTARAISHLPDRKARCELLEIGSKLPHVEASSSIDEALEECGN